jgi:MYXO-CTERM domain-containing protein
MSVTSTRLQLHLAAAAAVAAGIAGASADAQIVHFANQNLTINSDFNGLYLNVLTGAYNTTGGGGGTVAGGWHINPYGATSLTWWQNGSNGVNYLQSGGALTNLAPGAEIGASSPFATGGASTNLTLNGTSIVGFRFNVGTATHYGWFRIALSSTYGGQPRSIVDWAYESTAGASIAAGAVPAPGAFALLGLAGLAGSRRRR